MNLCACGSPITRKPGARGRLGHQCTRCRDRSETELEARRRARAAMPAECEACGAPIARPPRGIPKRFCSATCQHWAQLHPRERRPVGRTCPGCGASIDHRHLRAKWCSRDCAAATRQREKSAGARFPRDARCARCDGEYQQLRAPHLHCSTRCYQADYLDAHPEKRTRWRGSTRKQRLPRDWTRRRALVLKRDPTCRVCDAEPSAEVDHVDRGDDHSLKNLQGICEDCHKRKTQREADVAREQRRARARAVLVQS